MKKPIATTLYASINRAIRDDVMETINAEFNHAITELAEAYEREETLYEPTDRWHMDAIIDDMVVKTMNSTDMGDNEGNDDQRVFFRFIEGTLQAMAQELYDHWLELEFQEQGES